MQKLYKFSPFTILQQQQKTQQMEKLTLKRSLGDKLFLKGVWLISQKSLACSFNDVYIWLFCT